MKNTNTSTKGFTLIELLVVIAIIGILASVVLVAMNTAQMHGRDAKRVSDTKQMMNALEMYYTDNKTYPLTTGWVYSDTGTNWANILPSNDLVTMPFDPKNSGTFRYSYQSTCSGQGFWFSAVLEKDVPSRYEADKDDCNGNDSSALYNNPIGRFVIAKKP